MRMLLGIFALLLIFGCIGNGEEKPEPVVNETVEVEEPPPVSMVIEEQKNQTREEQVPETPPEEENETEAPSSTELQYSYEPDAPIGIYFIDVAGATLHGDSVLIKRGDLDVLVDAGPAENANRVVDFLDSRGVDDIEVLISTNADPRHYGGIETVAENFEIEHFWWGGRTFAEDKYIDIVKMMNETAKETRIVAKGYSIELNGISFEILNPSSDSYFDDVNNDAVVTRISEGNFSLLLMSGLQKGGTQKLANEQAAAIKCNVIQAPYFGTGEGTRDIGLFLVTATPDAMIITGSADDSAENGGSREPFERLLKQYNITAYKTYEEGDLRISTDGTQYAIRNMTFSG